jgi:NAD(P)-dependent dehydrogenase (short-subunit alcohol dehydrogenase family)
VLALTRLCGAGAGIGKSLAQKLAAQGLNVVLVALDVRAGRRGRGTASALSHTLGSRAAAAQEPLLTDTYGELKAAFPKLQFRKARADAAAIKPTGGAGLTRGTCRCTGWRELGHTRRLP